LKQRAAEQQRCTIQQAASIEKKKKKKKSKAKGRGTGTEPRTSALAVVT
jgi:hypothetical protein